MDLDSKLHHMTTPILTETPQGVVSQGSEFFYRVDGQPPDPNTPGWAVGANRNVGHNEPARCHAEN